MSKYMDSEDTMKPQDIRWETVKTEEEEYLDKLQSKLTRVMDGFQPAPPKGAEYMSGELSDMMRVSRPVSQAQDQDEGLHLMYDFPHSAAEDTSSQPFPSSPQLSQLPKIDVASDVAISSPRQRSVRFRSRVRITSGVHSGSSSCGSRSSSISVPLQGPHGPNVSKSIAPLSDILPSEAANARLSSVSSPHNATSNRVRHEARKNSVGSRSSPVDERTPLAIASHAGSRRSYTEQIEDEAQENEDTELDRLRAAARKSEEQVMFGKWHWRLLNRHWWWWKLEPIVCCCAHLDDSDLE